MYLSKVNPTCTAVYMDAGVGVGTQVLAQLFTWVLVSGLALGSLSLHTFSDAPPSLPCILCLKNLRYCTFLWVNFTHSYASPKSS